VIVVAMLWAVVVVAGISYPFYRRARRMGRLVQASREDVRRELLALTPLTVAILVSVYFLVTYKIGLAGIILLGGVSLWTLIRFLVRKRSRPRS
jgi:hypothetical protein